MGYATIVSGGEDGRYQIELDYGSATKALVLELLASLSAELDVKIAAAQLAVTEAEAEEADALARVTTVINEYIAALEAGLVADSKAIASAQKTFADVASKNVPLRFKLEALKFQKADCTRQVAYWNAFEPIERKAAWCTDFTEDGAGVVATIDVKAQSDLILIAPGARTWTPSDGVLTAREIQSPAQVYWNAAALPGVQKWKPNYRWGTITAIDYEADTATVELAEALSSAQSLDVNQADTLRAVPFEYMECDSLVFEVDDRVIVQFTGQAWESPKIVGFLDNPRPCNWTCVYLMTAIGYVFESALPSVMTQLLASSLTVEARINRGAWIPLTRDPDSDPTVESYSGEFDDGYPPELGGPSGSLALSFNSTPATSGIANGLPPRIQFQVSPSWPPSESRVRNVGEFRIRIGTDTVFNAAGLDTGWATESWYHTGAVKAPGGIALISTAGSGPSQPVDLLDYDLFIRTGT